MLDAMWFLIGIALFLVIRILNKWIDKKYPKRTWVGLTDEEKAEIQSLKWWDWEDAFDLDGYTRAIEAKLKEKNGA